MNNTIAEENRSCTSDLTMLEVTPRALRLLDSFFTDKAISPVRLFVKLGGCGIRSFGVALERPQKKDKIVSRDGYTFVIQKTLWDNVKPIRIDADRVSFRITGTGIQPNTGCGICGYACGLNGSSRCSGDCLACRLPCAHGHRARADLTGG
jgi:Fe-S cluster assembly iron-binding protein IscA